MWARLYVLVLMAVKSFNEGWSEFVPGNNDYSLISAHEWSFMKDKLLPLTMKLFSFTTAKKSPLN